MSSPVLDYDLAIIGAGFSGSMVAINALAAGRAPLRIALINKNADFGRGIAYGTRCPSHLLNVPAARMSAFVDDPDDFYLWLKSHESLCRSFGVDDAARDQFIPRALFGQYVSHQLERREREAPPGISLHRVVGDVQDLQECRGGMRVFLESDETLTARKVVLAPGNFPPGDPPLRDRAIYRSRCYLGTPWAGERMERIRDAKEVLILGSGLTAIDLILALREPGGKTERIHLLSRHGRLPQPHAPATPYPPFLTTQDRPRNIRELFGRVRGEVKRAAAEGINWRPVLDSMRAITPHLWQSLDRENKKRFLRHVRPLWELHRHRLPADILTEIAELEASGTLVRHAGRIESMRALEAGKGARVRYRLPGGGEAKEFDVEMIVNCTGPEANYRKLDNPLIVNLFARGIIHPDPLLLGLEVAPNGAVVNVAGNYSSTLYTLGSSRRGQLYETTAVPELRQQAQKLARLLVQDLQPLEPARGVAAFEI